VSGPAGGPAGAAVAAAPPAAPAAVPNAPAAGAPAAADHAPPGEGTLAWVGPFAVFMAWLALDEYIPLANPAKEVARDLVILASIVGFSRRVLARHALRAPHWTAACCWAWPCAPCGWRPTCSSPGGATRCSSRTG
jgi:hypothetical protein